MGNIRNLKGMSQKQARKLPQEHFKSKTSGIANKKTLIWLRRDHSKRESESLVMATQNNSMSKKNNY